MDEQSKADVVVTSALPASLFHHETDSAPSASLQPARTLGGRGLLVASGEGAAHAAAAGTLGIRVVPDLGAAVGRILAA